MNIVVVGAGQVGTAVAKGLHEANQVSVIDRNPNRLGDLRGEADVMTLEGDGLDIENLRDARVGDADIVIASTNDDRTNILVCATIEAINPEVFSIARVTNTDYLRSWRYSRKAFNVNFMVASEYLTAQRMVNLGFKKHARNVEYFGRGDIEMAEFEIEPGSPIAGKTVEDADTYDGLRYAAVGKDGQIEVATGQTVIPAGGTLLVIGRTDEVYKLSRVLSTGPDEPIDDVFILGGGGIGEEIVASLHEEGVQSTLIEKRNRRARQIAEKYSNCFVLNNDPKDPDFLESERVDEADLILSAIPSDETNFFASLQLQELGADRIVAAVDESKYVKLFEDYGIDAAVNPREEVIEEIFRYTRGRELEGVTFIEEHRGEVIELTLDEDSILVGRPLKESATDLPNSLVIGALYRDGHVIIPTGETVPGSGDEVVIFIDTEVVDEVIDTI
jgi:trk system potassium uptake protein TrkA